MNALTEELIETKTGRHREPAAAAAPAEIAAEASSRLNLTGRPPRPAWIEIDLGQLRRNFQLINQDKPPAVRLLSVVDHHIDGVTGLYRNFAGRGLKFLDRNNPLALVPEIDDDILAGNAEDGALQDLVGGGRGKVAVIFEELLVVLDLPVVLFHGYSASAAHCVTQYCVIQD